MAKASYTYVIIRFLFGIYLIYHGYSGYQEVQQNQGYFYQTVDRFIKELPINLTSLKSSSAEILSVANILIMIGGFFVIQGYKISKYFVAMGMVTDFIFVHNFLHLNNGKMMNFTIKALSVLGGALVVH